MSDEEYLTPEEVAGRLKVTRRTVYRWITSGQLKAVKAGTGWRVAKTALTDFLQGKPGTANSTGE